MRTASGLALALCIVGTVSAQDLCNQRPRICINGATCTEGGGALGVTCECQQGFSGERCEIDIDECESNPCMNGGTCENRKGGWTCECVIGTFGTDCSITVDPCADDPCENGNCVQTGATSYECIECPPGFAGVNCVDTDYCEDSPCLNGGLCSNIAENDGYICSCPAMYYGVNCESYDGCIQEPCLNGGVCTNGDSAANPYTCTCLTPWYGLVCESKDEIVRPCESNPCYNDAACSDNGITYKCDCQPGYYGTVCQGALPCLSNPCQNGGECENSAAQNMFICACPLGFGGEMCETEINACDNSPCQNEGVCTPGPQASYTCECPLGTQGTNCEQFINECESNPCVNGGTCNDLLGAYQCTCPALTTGTNCEVIIELCKGVECPNGRCDVDADTRTTICVCDDGFMKKDEDCIDINECETGDHTCDPVAMCANVDGTYTCTCPETHIGDGYTCTCDEGFYADGERCIACRSPDHCLSPPPATCTGEPLFDDPCPTSICEEGYISTDASPCKWKLLVGVNKPIDEIDLDEWAEDVKEALDVPYLDVLGATEGEFPNSGEHDSDDTDTPADNPDNTLDTPTVAEVAVNDTETPVGDTDELPADTNAAPNADTHAPVDPNDGGETDDITIILAAELSEDDTLENISDNDYVQEQLGDAGDVNWVLSPEKDNPILSDGTEPDFDEQINEIISNSDDDLAVIDCEAAFAHCDKCHLTACLDCNDGYALDPIEAICTECASLHGALCATCSLDVCLSCVEGYSLVQSTNTCAADRLQIADIESGEQLTAPAYVSYNDKRKQRQAIMLNMKPSSDEVAAAAADKAAQTEIKARQARRASTARESQAQAVMAGAITAVFLVMVF